MGENKQAVAATVGVGSEFVKLSGNWLNIPNISNFKLHVRSRVDSMMDITIHGFIRRNEADKRSPYHIYSKTSQVHSTANLTHYFDSQMEHYNSEEQSACGRNCKPVTDEKVERLKQFANFKIPFHQMLNQAYENNTYFYNQQVVGGNQYQIYDNVMDGICKDSDIVVTYFHEQYFLLCLVKNGREISSLKHIVGREFIATVKTFTNSNFQKSIEQFQNESHKFPKKKVNAALIEQLDEDEKPQKRSTLKMNADPTRAYFFQSNSHACILPWLKGSKCKSQSTTMNTNSTARSVAELPKKRCVFIHGYGTNMEFSGAPVFHSSHFRDGEYWGKIDNYTPQCSERVFMREETNYRGWINTELQQSVCNIILGDSKDNVIKNTIIFAHSMGNMMLAGAIMNGYCSIDKETTSWYNIMGPIQGTSVANAGSALCNHKLGIDKLVTHFGLCEKPGTPSEALYSLSTECNLLPQIKPIVEQYVKGYMCGVSKLGVHPMSGISIGLKIVGSTFLATHYNDGVVPLYSCKNTIPAQDFVNDYSSNFYRVKANHFDGTCANGDGWFDSSSPCSFYLNKY